MLDKSINIFLIFRSPRGGLFRHIKDLTANLNKQGYKVGLIFSNENLLNHEDLEALKGQAQLGVFRLKMSRHPSLLDILALLKICRILRGNSGGILHGHGAKGGLYARLAAILLGDRFKAIYTLHGGVLHFNKRSLQGFLYFKIEKFLQKYTNGIIFESVYARNQFKKKLGQVSCSSSVIHNGITSEDFIECPKQKSFDFIFLGELRILKGVEYLLQAVSILQKEGRKISLGIYGAGSDELKFRVLAHELNISNLCWMGYASNAKDALLKTRCLVVPSLSESLPYVLMEAGAIRCPIIATNVGGIPEILGEKYPMASPGNSLDLAEKMRWFLDESELHITLQAQEIKERVHRLFNVNYMAKMTLAFYADQFNTVNQ